MPKSRPLLTGLLFVSPWLLGFLIFTVFPVIASLYLSFTDYRVLSPPRWVGLANYKSLLTDTDYFWPSLANTAFLFLELPLSLGLGLALALLLNQKLRGIAVYRTFLFVPSIVPVVASAMLWMLVLNPEHGLLNAGLRAIHLQGPPWLASPLWAKPAMILMDLWGVGGGMVIYLAALQAVPAALYEAASLDGANFWHRTWYITLPSISPVIFFNLIMGVIGTFQYFTQTFVMTKGGPDNSTLFYALYLYQNAFEYFRMGTACAMAWILFIITLAATALVFKSSARWVYYEGESR
ncbi:MAG: carbohydrate ABC transporter permease [Janthinobacterium lividum]